MPGVDVNFLALVVAALISMVVGFLWYDPYLFATAWSKATGKKMEDMGNGTTGYALTFLGALVQAWVLVHFVRYAGSDTFFKGLVTAFWLWLAFAAVTSLVNQVFENRSWKLWKINAGYFFIVLCLNGGLLAVWR